MALCDMNPINKQQLWVWPYFDHAWSLNFVFSPRNARGKILTWLNSVDNRKLAALSFALVSSTHLPFTQ